MSNKAATSKTSKTASKRKKPSAKSPASKRPSLAGLSSDLESLESRLKKIDTGHNKAIKEIESFVGELAASAGKTSPSQKAALTRGLNTLEKKLNAKFKTATQTLRASIRTDLAEASTSEGGITTLEAALKTAHTRLDAHEATQRDAIASINRHIASLATAVDARLSAESEARRTDMTEIMERLAETEATIGKRIEGVEDDTAEALNRIGDKVAEFAAVLDQRADKSDAETAERLADLAQETQAEFDHGQADLTTRLEALETIAAEWSPPSSSPNIIPANMDDPRIDRMGETLGQLQDEISRLHARLASVQANASVSREPQTNVVPIARPIAQPAVPPVMPTLRDDNPYAAAYTPEAESPPQANEKPTKTEGHIPVEYDPTAYQAQPQVQPQTAPQLHALEPPSFTDAPQALSHPAPDLPPLPDFPPQLPPQLPPMASLGSLTPHAPFNAEPLSAPEPLATYSDPAYADQDEMRAERITEDTGRRPSLPSLPSLPISGRNIRIGALALGVAVVGLIAGKAILGGTPVSGSIQDTPSLAAQNGQENFTAETVDFSSENITNGRANDLPIASTPPLGNYSETAVPQITTDQQTTLAAAVEAGNPIAQFQLGLNKLQAGEPEEAARLIRLAANRNQPAAQYRLAKLYETGTGVTKDTVTARELVERAAIGGNRIAMHDLGNYHFYGQGGLERDPATALEWFSKAAERGVVDSQFNVAFLREGGQGIAEDLSVAYFWYNIAARQGDQGAPGRIAAIGPQLDETTRNKIESDAARFNPKPVDEAANGLFREVPWIRKSTQVSDADRAARITKIKTVQTLLTDLGFDIGGADGAAGPKTKSAVREFQKVNGMSETGEITDDLIQRLEIAAGV